MNAHTPGSWTYGVRKDGSIWLSIGDYQTGTHYQGDVVCSEADARLIAAAPDLLEALQSFNMKEQDIVGAQAGHLILRVPMDVIAKMAAAIAKATGGAA